MSKVIYSMLFDAVLAVAALLAAIAVRFGNADIGGKLSDSVTLVTMVIFVVAVIFSSHLMEVYDESKNLKKREVVVNVLFGAATSFSLISVAYYLGADAMLGRGILFIALCIFVPLQLISQTLQLIGKRQSRFSRRVLVLGTGDLALQIGEMISSRIHNFTLVGYAFCDTDSGEKTVDTVSPIVPQDRIMGSCDDLLGMAQLNRVDLIVMALSERRGVFPLRDVLRCKLNGIQIMDAPSLYELAQGKLMLESITPSWFIFSDGFRRNTIMNTCKRAIDVALSGIGLLMTLPFFPLIALAIKLDSPGPVLFRQERVGNHERLFVLYKFRTMGQDAEKASGAVWAEKNDPRVTRLGKFFRGSRIDEIPQLINVLKGDMSFIGPRPERLEFVEKLKLVIPFYSKRHFIKPGLTGWAQVRYPYGASVEDAFEKLRYDLYYIKNMGPNLDTLIFFETIKVVLFGYGGR